MDALARGWNEEVDGPRPDVWTPAVAVLGRCCCSSAPRPQRQGPTWSRPSTPSIAQTPLVIAMPKPMAEALGWPDKPHRLGRRARAGQRPEGLGRQAATPSGARSSSARPTRNFSTSGLNATDRRLLRRHRAVQRPAPRRTSPTRRSPRLRQGRRGLGRALRRHHADLPVEPAARRRPGAGLTYISAVAVEEKSVWDYNQGNPTGDPATLGEHAKPKVPLVAVYPKEGTLLSDNPYVVLTAPWVDDARRQAAADFLAYLQAPGAAEAVHRRGLPRRRRQARRALITRANGAAAGQPSTVLEPAGAATVLDQVRAVLGRSCASGPGCCWCIDTSGSMGDAAPAAAAAKLDLAKQAAMQALPQFGAGRRGRRCGCSRPGRGRDRPTGSWSRPGAVSAVLPAVQQQGRGAGAGRRDRALRRPRGTRSGRSQGSFDREPDQRGGAAHRRQERVPAGQQPGRACCPTSAARTPRRRCGCSRSRTAPAADLDILKQIAAASRAAAYDASDPASITNVLTAVLSNF